MVDCEHAELQNDKDMSNLSCRLGATIVNKLCTKLWIRQHVTHLNQLHVYFFCCLAFRASAALARKALAANCLSKAVLAAAFAKLNGKFLVALEAAEPAKLAEPAEPAEEA